MRRNITFTKGIVNDGVELSVALGHELSRAPEISDIPARGITLSFAQANTNVMASHAKFRGAVGLTANVRTERLGSGVFDCRR